MSKLRVAVLGAKGRIGSEAVRAVEAAEDMELVAALGRGDKLETLADSAAFKLENQYFLLLKVSAAADLIGEEVNALKIEGAPRMLLAAGVEDVDAAFETLKGRHISQTPNRPALGPAHRPLCRPRRQYLGDQSIHRIEASAI